MSARERDHSDSLPSGPSVVLSFLVLAFILTPFFLLSCGKKGPPTLRSFKQPSSPVLQSVLHREDAIIIFWSFPRRKEKEIAGFEVLRSSDGEYRKIAEADKNVRSFADTNFSDNAPYQYMVIARTSSGIASPGSNVLRVRPVQLPRPPEDLSFTIKSDSVILSWKGTGGGSLYNIYRRFEGEKYGMARLNDMPLSENSFRDELFIDRTVFYTVRNLRDTGVWNEGRPSRELVVSARELVPSEPEGLSYFTTSDRVFLFWTAPEETWIRGFRIYRRMNEAGYSLIAETRIPTFIDADNPGTPRDYRITTLGPEKESPAAGITVDFSKDR
jgi:hypothetical protein